MLASLGKGVRGGVGIDGARGGDDEPVGGEGYIKPSQRVTRREEYFATLANLGGESNQSLRTRVIIFGHTNEASAAGAGRVRA